MIVSSLADRLNQFISWLLYGRQWAAWEILTIAVIAVVVLLWIMSRRRSRKVRRIFEDQFRVSPPVIGANLGARKRSRHVIEDLKKARLVSIHKHNQQQHEKTKEPSEKLHEEIKQLQHEIFKQKQTELHLEQQVAELTAANEELQRELAESKQALLQTQRQTAEVPAADEHLQHEVSQVEQVEQKSEEKVVTESSIEKPAEIKLARKDKDYEDVHRVTDGVNQKLCRRCKEWKAESEFHKNSSSKDGLSGSCKACKTNAARDYRKRRKAAKG
jgi:septal ring factor EnvC (AmiA/AmiB activator)